MDFKFKVKFCNSKCHAKKKKFDFKFLVYVRKNALLLNLKYANCLNLSNIE